MPINIQEGIWRWERTAAIFDYTNWDNFEPNNSYGSEDCLQLFGPNYGFKWNDLSCNDFLGHNPKPLCQKFR